MGDERHSRRWQSADAPRRDHLRRLRRTTLVVPLLPRARRQWRRRRAGRHRPQRGAEPVIAAAVVARDAKPPLALVRMMNPVLRLLLRTPLARALRPFALLEFTGRRSGRRLL